VIDKSFINYESSIYKIIILENTRLFQINTVKIDVQPVWSAQCEKIEGAKQVQRTGRSLSKCSGSICISKVR